MSISNQAINTEQVSYFGMRFEMVLSGPSFLVSITLIGEGWHIKTENINKSTSQEKHIKCIIMKIIRLGQEAI
jgi:hypothetical protein